MWDRYVGPNLMPFRFASEKAHLTYKTHMDEVAVKAMLESKGTLKIYSFVHEVGDDNEDNPTPYEHTHVFVWWTKRLDLTDHRTFDVNNIHPNIQTKRGIQWAKTIVQKYHKGHKTKKNGKKYFIEPVYLNQEGVDEWKFEEELWDCIADAPSLKDACLDAGLVPKSISDAKLIQSESKRRKLNPPKYTMDKFNRPAQDLSLPLLIYGGSDCGP